MSNVSQLALAQQYLTRYGMTTYVILGNIGLLFNIAIFSQPTHRRNPCSIYILAASFCAFLGLNICAIPIIYQVDHYSSIIYTQLYCRLQFYLRHSVTQMMRTFFIFACADRYAISSKNIRIRSYSQYQIAIRTIPCVILFWLLLSILPMMLGSFENGKCDAKSGVYSVILTIYVLSVLGIFPLVSATIFGVLLNRNLKTVRGCVQQMRNTNVPINQLLRKRDRDMLRMLVIEVICYTSTSAPTVFMLIYRVATQKITKNNERLQIESFINYLTLVFLLYGNTSLSFWIYICTSRSFRLELKNLIIKWYTYITYKQAHINEI